MAEVLGVVASGISVASFAIQLADSIKKLKDFVDDVRDAPEDIKYTIHELDTLNLQLADIEKELQQNPASTSNDTSLQQCLSLCQKGTSALDSIVKDLESEMKTRKRRTAVKTWLKKGILEKYDKRLERAKSSLMLSYLIYTKNVQTKLIIEVRQAVLFPPATATTANTTVQQDMIGHSRKQTCINKQPQDKKRYHLNLTLWLIAKAWNTTLSQSVTGWNIHFRSYAVIPEDSPIFTACRKGDLKTVKILFNSGQASPFCKGERFGSTPLHCAASRWDPDKSDSEELERISQLCQFLINKGADNSVEDASNHTPAEAFRLRPKHDDVNTIAFMKVLLKDSSDFDMEFLDKKYAELAVDWAPDVTRWLHEQVWPPYQDIPLLQRLEYALRALSCTLTQSLKESEAIIGCKLLKRAVLDTAFANDATLCFFATTMQAYGAFKFRAWAAGPTSDTEDWSEVLIEAIERNVDLQNCQTRDANNHAMQSSNCRTAMTNFVQGWQAAMDLSYGPCGLCHTKVRYVIGRAVETWFSKLHDLGIDLDAFAGCESKALEAHEAHDSTPRYLRYLRAHDFTPSGFKYLRADPHLSWVVKLHGMKKSSRSGRWKLCFGWPPRRLYQLFGRPRPSSRVPGGWGDWDSTDESGQSDEDSDTWEDEQRRYGELRFRYRAVSELEKMKSCGSSFYNIDVYDARETVIYLLV